MKRLTNKSDKFNDYSDYERKNPSSSKQTTRHFATSIGIYRFRFIAWLSYRNVQEMRQNWLQMFKWPWSWTKVLFIYQLPWRKAKNALCPKGVSESGKTEVTKFSKSKTNARGDLRIEPRIIEKARRSLDASDLCRRKIRPLGFSRCFSIMHSHCKYARGLSFRSSGGRRWGRF
jgi:hypothetical protein